jgi:small-conductance mechanosensitive channel
MKVLFFLLRIALVITYLLHELKIVQLKQEPTFRRWGQSRYDWLDYLGIFLAFTVLLDLIYWAVVWLYRRNKKLPDHKTDNFILGVGHIFNLLLFTGIALTVLKLLDLNIKDVFLSFSIVAASLAITFKDYVTNFLNGMLITFANELSIDDYVRIGEYEGKIIDITLSNVRLLNDDDDIVYVPNNLVMSKEVVNYSKGDVKKTTVDFEMDYRFVKTAKDLEEQIIRSMEPFAHQIRPGSHILRIWELQRDKIVFKFQFVLERYDKGIDRNLRRHIERFVVDYVRATGDKRYF